MTRHIAPLALAVALAISAPLCAAQRVIEQYWTFTQNASDVRIAFKDPLTLTTQCGNFATTEPGSPLRLRFTSPPQTSTCFNLNNLNSNLEAARLVDSNITLDVLELARYNASGNYSVVSFSQGGVRDEVQGGIGNYLFQVYEEADCGSGSGKYEWNCGFPDISCTFLPVGVRSFSVGPVAEEERGGSTCVRASLGKNTPILQGGGAAGSLSMSVLGSAVVGVVGLVLLQSLVLS